MISPHHPNGSPPRPIGKFDSVSDAARKLGMLKAGVVNARLEVLGSAAK